MAMEARNIDKGTDGGNGELAGMRIAILAETLYEDLELWYPYYRLREAGADVFVVGAFAVAESHFAEETAERRSHFALVGSGVVAALAGAEEFLTVFHVACREGSCSR